MIFSSSTRTLTVQVGDAGGDEGDAVRAKLDAGGAGRGGSRVGCGAGEAAPAEGLATGGGHGGGGGGGGVDGFRFDSSAPLGPITGRRMGRTFQISFGPSPSKVWAYFLLPGPSN